MNFRLKICQNFGRPRAFSYTVRATRLLKYSPTILMSYMSPPISCQRRASQVVTPPQKLHISPRNVTSNKRTCEKAEAPPIPVPPPSATIIPKSRNIVLPPTRCCGGLWAVQTTNHTPSLCVRAGDLTFMSSCR